MNTSMKMMQVGYTLVELMVALVLTAFMVVGAISLHLSGRQSTNDSEQMSRIQENLRFASDYIVRDIRNAGFRDEASLRWGHEEQIREQYAAILDGGVAADSGDALRIRYAGRGHCTEAFEEYRLVENEYFVNTESNELTCRGRSISQNAAGQNRIENQLWGRTIGLVRGVTAIRFDKISVGDTACVFDLKAWADDPAGSNLCTGTTVTLQLEGLRDLHPGPDHREVTTQLTAAFRNVILEMINENAFTSES